ncbi:MAG: peptide chain release factor-like protein [Terrimicrobiaceae bacterium]|nr:peptide chain release factor-like protein [Terrimicrobiaceae bacterium]
MRLVDDDEVVVAPVQRREIDVARVAGLAAEVGVGNDIVTEAVRDEGIEEAVGFVNRPVVAQFFGQRTRTRSFFPMTPALNVTTEIPLTSERAALVDDVKAYPGGGTNLLRCRIQDVLTRKMGLSRSRSALNHSLVKQQASHETQCMFDERMVQLGIRPEDLVETFARSSGPGGQNVNKVSTAVTLLHRPSGLRVVASDSRSQFANRKLAMERLLDEFERREGLHRQSQLAELSKARRQRAKRSRGTKRKLVESKRRRGETKRMRGKVSQ